MDTKLEGEYYKWVREKGIKILIGLGIFLIGAVVGFGATKVNFNLSKGILSPIGIGVRKVDKRPLDAFTYEALRKRNYQGSEVTFDHVLKTTPEYTTWLFFYNSDGKRISGALDMPVKLGSPSAGTSLFQFSSGTSRPLDSARGLIIMIHGFVEEKGYYSGFGTERVAGELAKKGYVTLAPDFAGLGESDKVAKDDFEARFETYTTVLNLISSVCKSKLSVIRGQFSETSLPVVSQSATEEQKTGGLNSDNGKQKTDNCKVGMWGHSNGGQIALSVLEISGLPIPTVLWNPVSKFFPYSILYYIDQFDDKGKYLRGSLANFEKKYDVEKYSLDNYFDWITAPILLQQGGADRDVPVWWSDALNQGLRVKGKDIKYIVYPGADHNLMPSWSQAVADLEVFFSKEL